MKRTGSAAWQGGLKDGNGTITTASGALRQAPYSFSARFESGAGTNPEELVGAAHAGCFSQALAAQLENAGLKAQRIDTTATVTLETTPAGPAISAVHLDVDADVPGASKEAFDTAAENAKNGCPVSKLLNAQITMNAKLAA